MSSTISAFFKSRNLSLNYFTIICAAITQKKKQVSIIMNSYEAQMGILAKRQTL